MKEIPQKAAERGWEEWGNPVESGVDFLDEVRKNTSKNIQPIILLNRNAIVLHSNLKKTFKS